MRTTWEKIVYNVGTIDRQDISNKLQNKTKVSIPKPEYTEYVHSKHRHRVELLNLRSARVSKSREAKRGMLNQAEEDGNEPEAPINIEILENDI